MGNEEVLGDLHDISGMPLHQVDKLPGYLSLIPIERVDALSERKPCGDVIGVQLVNFRGEPVVPQRHRTLGSFG